MNDVSDRPGTGESSAHAALPPVALEPWESGRAVVIQPGANVGDLEAVLGRMPGDACFVEAFGDVDIMLVFQPPWGTAEASAPALGGADR